MAGISFHHSQDMARDKEKSHLEVILDSQYLLLKGTGPDVEPTTLSGHVTLFLTEATSIKEITLQFKGKAKIPIQPLDSIITSNVSSSQAICNHEWSFLEGDKKRSHTLKAGRHSFPFHLEISGSLPSTISTPASGGASIAYNLRALATRPGFSHNLQAVAPVYILRSMTHEALEYQQTLDIENTWPDKIMYSIMLPHKAWAAGDTLTAIVKLCPLAKGVYVQAILSSLSETTKIHAKTGIQESTRVVTSVRHEMIDHKAVEVDFQPPNSSAAAGSSTAHSPPISRPPSPFSGSGSSSSHHHHNNPHQEQQEEEDLGFDNNDVVTHLNLSIPPVSAYPLLYSTSPPTSASPSSHSQPSTSLFSFTNATASPNTTPPLSTSPTHQHVPLPPSANSAASHPTGSSLGSSLTVTPSHGLEPIIVSHRIMWNIFIRNKDGHISELRCSLPIKVLDGALLEESRGFTMRARRLLLRASGLGGVLGRDGEEGNNEDEGDETGEERRIRSMEADRELPSYAAHIRDRVANMYLSEAATMRVSNPWVGRVGPASTASGSALSSPEVSGQGESQIINTLIATVSLSDPPTSADRLSALHTQLHSRASRSGHNTPPIPLSQQQQVHMMSHLPHVPGSGESTPLDWVNSELLLSLSLDEEALRRIGGVPSSVGGQQQLQPQPQPQQQQQQTHGYNQRQSRTFRWGSRLGSRAASRAASPERNALSSANDDNNPGSIPEGNTGGGHDSPGTASSTLPPSSSPGSGLSPFQNLFKATMKPFTSLTGHHHHGHGHRLLHSRSYSTTSLSGLPSLTNAGSATRPLELNPDPSAPVSGLSLTGPPSGAGPPSSSTSSPDASISSSPLSDPTLGSTSARPSPTAPNTTSPLSHTTHELESHHQGPSSFLYRAFTEVPDYSIASRGFIGGVPPLSSMRGLPSYEEAEAQRKEREEAHALRDDGVQMEMILQSQTQTRLLSISNQSPTSSSAIQTRTTQMQAQNHQVIMGEMKMKMKMRERLGSMSEPDLAGRFGHTTVVCFEAGTAKTGSCITEADNGGGGGVGILQRLEDGDEDEDDDDDDDETSTIQMRSKKTRP